MSFFRIALHVIVVGAVPVPTLELIEGECSASDSNAPVADSVLVQKLIRVTKTQTANSNGYAEVPPGAFYPRSLIEAGGVECRSWCESDFNDGDNQGRHCSPGDMAHLCGGCSFCEGAPAETCESQWGNMACAGTECYTCGDRVAHLINSQGSSSSAARTSVGNEFPAECGACSGGGGPVPSPPTPPSGDSIQIRVVSYNLYWWNAFQQNEWKSQGIVDNIKNTLLPDTLGMQECDDPGQIESRAGGYYAASPYEGAQGVSVKPGVFSVESSGSRDLQATGYYGPRYVTWAKLRHSASGRSFWHFNTHWCVQDCDQWKRYDGAKNMVSTIQEMAGSEPVVVTGDFNARQGEPGIEHFLRNGFAIAERNWVDSVFYSTAHWTRVGHWIGDAAGSDHHPLVADLRLN